MSRDSQLVVNLIVGVVPADKKGMSKDEQEAIVKNIVKYAQFELEQDNNIVNPVVLDAAAADHLHYYNRERVIKWKEQVSLKEFINHPENIQQAKMQALYLKEYVMERLGTDYFSLADVVEHCDANNFVTLMRNAKIVDNNAGQHKVMRKFLTLLQAFNFVAVKMNGKRELFTVTMTSDDLRLHVENVIHETEVSLKAQKTVLAQIKKEATKENRMFKACEKIVHKAMSENLELVDTFKPIGAVQLSKMENMERTMQNTKVNDKILDLTWPAMVKKGLLRFDAARIVWDSLEDYANGRLKLKETE